MVLAPGPWRPSKLRLEVETESFPAGILSSFMARHAEHPGCRISNPAASSTRSSPSSWICLLTIHDPGHIGAVMLTYEGTDKTVWDIVKEFEIEPLDDYFNRCRAHRSAALSAEDIP